jgi:D-alanyl-lipoteichoic acid acyltransferase DltB (MBOAT superfamily)
VLFNSFEFLFSFLPIGVVGFFVIGRYSGRMAIWWLVLASFFFYASWRLADLPVFLGSVLLNFAAIRRMRECTSPAARTRVLWLAVAIDLTALAFFKYGDFIASNVEWLTHWRPPLPKAALPLGISFFTFTQITCLVDAWRYGDVDYPLSRYALFVSFYPHLLAGPILHHGDMMPQFAEPANRKLRIEHLWRGLSLLGVGLAKKTMLADAFAPYVKVIFDSDTAPSFIDAWLGAAAYYFQIYFDFSGYTDMAIGAALLFNVRLPYNFNSPYHSSSIREFWRRWHITLGAFFRDYVYIPLGGNRFGAGRTLINLFLVALLSGLWHGAAWSFVLWGGNAWGRDGDSSSLGSFRLGSVAASRVGAHDRVPAL